MDNNPLMGLPSKVKALLFLVMGVILLFTGYGAIVGVIFILLAIMLFRE